LALAFYARRFWRWPFGPAWWAFTFPLDALAFAATRYAQEHSSGPWKTIAGIALLAATAVVAIVLARTLLGARYLFSKRL
jgi:tellurite resistance protein